MYWRGTAKLHLFRPTYTALNENENILTAAEAQSIIIKWISHQENIERSKINSPEYKIVINVAITAAAAVFVFDATISKMFNAVAVLLYTHNIIFVYWLTTDEIEI